MRKRSLNPLFLSLALFGVVALMGCSTAAPLSEEEKIREEPVVLLESPRLPVGDSPARGAADAWVHLVVFGDFQDPFSGRLALILDEVVAASPPGVVRLVFKHFPAEERIGGNLAARAAEAAHLQGRFWEYRDALFDAPYLLYLDEKEIREALLALAGEAGLDQERFRKDLDSEELAERVKEDRRLGEELGLWAAPAVFINGGMIDGVQEARVYGETIARVHQVLEEAVASGEMSRDEVYLRSVEILLER